MFALVAFVVGLAPTCLSASDKSGYTLWSPVPTALLREMSADRPDRTESPYTVDAGHFQVELDFINFTADRDRSDGGDVRTKIWSIAPLNLKAGLSSRVDLQLVLEPYVRSRSVDRLTGVVIKAAGFGDVTTRLKINFWGNDGGSTAFGIMPVVKWPLSASGLRNGETEGGVILPFAMQLPAGFGLGVMTEVDFVSNGSDGHDREFVNSMTVSRDFTNRTGGFVEFVAVSGSAPHFKWQGFANAGLTYALNQNAQLDLGCNFGVTKSAPDYQPFVGATRRF